MILKSLKISLLAFLSFPLLAFSDTGIPYYTPRIELTGKLGYSSDKSQRRDLGRLGFVLPLYQNGYSMTFATVIGVMDTAKHMEGNFGVGHRYLLKNSWILGGYGFYDLYLGISKHIFDDSLPEFQIFFENKI